MHAIHAIASGHSNKWSTCCGMLVYTTDWPNEYETATDIRIEAAPINDNRTVTCKRCLKSIAKAPKGDGTAQARYL